MQLVQVPSKPAVGPRFRQPDVAHIENRTGQEVLGGSVQPALHEQRVLAGRRATLLQPLDRSAAQRMITTALRVEIRGLLPQFVGELVPAQPKVTTLRVKRVEECVIPPAMTHLATRPPVRRMLDRFWSGWAKHGEGPCASTKSTQPGDVLAGQHAIGGVQGRLPDAEPPSQVTASTGAIHASAGEPTLRPQTRGLPAQNAARANESVPAIPCCMRRQRR
jgi:hypothetical protein